MDPRVYRRFHVSSTERPEKVKATGMSNIKINCTCHITASGGLRFIFFLY